MTRWLALGLTLSLVGLVSQGNASAQTPLAETRQSAAQGYADAQFNLGLLYSIGEGVPQDFAQAATWYRKAADQDHAAAQFNLGFLYGNGQGVPQDFAQAAAWYRRAADQGFADPQFKLGLMYTTGKGVPQDFAQAVAWYRRAADQGFAPAQVNLGVMYRDGEGRVAGLHASGGVVAQSGGPGARRRAVQPRPHV